MPVDERRCKPLAERLALVGREGVELDDLDLLAWKPRGEGGVHDLEERRDGGVIE